MAVVLSLHYSTFITANLTFNLVTEIFFYAWRWNTKKRSSCAAIETCVAVSKKCRTMRNKPISQFGVSKNTCARRDKKKHIFFFFCHAKYTHEFALKKICIFKICLILSRRARVFFETPNYLILSAELCRMAQKIVSYEHLLQGTTKQKEINKT